MLDKIEQNGSGGSKRRRVTAKPRKIEAQDEVPEVLPANQPENVLENQQPDENQNVPGPEVKNLYELLNHLPTMESSADSQSTIQKILKTFNDSMGYQKLAPPPPSPRQKSKKSPKNEKNNNKVEEKPSKKEPEKSPPSDEIAGEVKRILSDIVKEHGEFKKAPTQKVKKSSKSPKTPKNEEKVQKREAPSENPRQKSIKEQKDEETEEAVKNIMLQLEKEHGEAKNWQHKRRFSSPSPKLDIRTVREQNPALMELLERDREQQSSPDPEHQNQMMRMIRKKVRPIIKKRRPTYQERIDNLPMPTTLADIMADPEKLNSVRKCQSYIRILVECADTGENMVDQLPRLDDADMIFVVGEMATMRGWSFPQTARFLMGAVERRIRRAGALSESSIHTMINLVVVLKAELAKNYVEAQEDAEPETSDEQSAKKAKKEGGAKR